jgi:hypothetical protein
MTDDDRRLADRLRRPESRVPVTDGPLAVRPRPLPWPALAALAAVLVVAVVLASGLVRNEPAVGQPSPTPPVSAGGTPLPTDVERAPKPITAVSLEDEGRALTVEFSGDRCVEDYAAEFVRADGAIEVAVYGTPTHSVDPCPAPIDYPMVELTIPLDPRFTGSQVRDVATGRIFTVAAASASASASPVTPSATPAPTPPPTDTIARWTQVGVFSADGWATEVLDMTYAAGRFIAIGYREPAEQRGLVGPPIDTAMIWTSPDGRTWEQVDPGPEFRDGHPRTLVALEDGSAVAYGTIDPEPPASPRTAAWRTTDGRGWELVELTTPRAEFLPHVVGGPNGLMTVVSLVTETSRTEEIWHSDNGTTWRVVHRIEPHDGYEPNVTAWEAGPDGFVLTGAWYRFEGGTRDDRPFVLASGEGIAWHEAPATETARMLGVASIAPLGGDWIIAASKITDGGSTGGASTWLSANGLDWEEGASLDVPMPSSPFPDTDTGTVIGRLVGTGERVIASGHVVICCHGPTWAAGVWSSTSASSWERLGFPEGTVVSAAAEHGGTVVIAGFDRARPEDEFEARAVFWIGERD